MGEDGKIVVVKLGTSTLVGAGRTVDEAYLAQLAGQLAALRAQGWKPVVVSSGAIACGVAALGLRERPRDIPSLQAAASVGAVELAGAWARALSPHGITSSLVLLTRHDTASRSAYLHARDALRRLVELDVVPIVNENDTTSVEEIRFGDNDTLAAVVSCLVQARLCVIFSDIDGFYDGNPATDPGAKLVPVVRRVDEDVLRAAGGAGSTLGSGGMLTKVRAARVLMAAGIPMAVCNGREPDALLRLAAGGQVGTLFAAGAPRHEITGRKLWIALGDAPSGALVVDDGAKRALLEQGSSLLCVGVVRVEGAFDCGDVVDVKDASGHLFARGKVSASSDEVELARGCTQKQLAANRLLAPMAASPVVHRDELVVFE